MTDDTNAKQEFSCFVSMPFSPEFDFIYDESIFKINRFLNNKYELHMNRLDKQAYRKRKIEDNVLRNIDLCDFLIADISPYQNTNLPNVSVMHEIGYATGRNRPFILIGTKETYRTLPANLKGSLVVEYDKPNDPNLQDFSKRLGEQIIKTIEDHVLSSLCGEQMVHCFGERPHAGLIQLIENSSHRVYILTTNLNYADNFLKKAIIHSLEKNQDNPKYKVEILTMDPESDVANARAIQLGTSIRQYRNELRSSLDSMNSDLNKYGNMVQIITYQTLPTQMAFVIDDVVITCVVSFGQQGRESVHFLMDKDTGLIDPFLAHFRAMKTLAMANVNIR